MYAKVFCQIFDSSIADNWQHRHVFEDLLKLADRNGIVDMTPEAIVARTRLPKEMVFEALDALGKPDPRSRSREEEGRRIVLIDPERTWGWRIVNYCKYRDIKTEFDRKAYMASYMRNHRALKRVKLESNGSLTESNVLNSSVSVSVSSSEGGAGGIDHRTLHWLRSSLLKLFKTTRGLTWPNDEEHMLVELVKRPGVIAEFKEIAAFKPKAGRYFPQSIRRLLENWDKVKDESRQKNSDDDEEESNI
jgi:hypothetical protein